MRSALATRTMAAPIGKLGKAGKAVVLRGQGSTDKLTLDKSWYCAHPGAGELMVHTVSTSVNPIDCYQRSGGAKLQFFPKVLGSDVAGVVVQAPEGSQFSVNDKVFALTDGYFGEPGSRGTYAEYVLVKEGWAARVPEELPLRIAGAVPLAALTAWQALQAKQLQAGQRVLIFGASGGVGHFAVQLAKLRGAHVVGVCSAEHAELVRNLGADETFDYHQGAAALRDKFGAKENTKFDLVFDVVGGELLETAAAHLVKAASGAVVHVRNAGLDDTAVKRHEHAAEKGTGPPWFSILVKPSGEHLARIAELLQQGQLRVHVAHVLPLEEVAKAHAMVESHHAGGKIVLKVS